MKLMPSILSAGLLAATATACDKASAPSEGPPASETMPMGEAENQPMLGHDADIMDGDTGHAKGTIVSISPDGGSVTIDHGPFEGIGMGAMTMNFALMGDADLTGFSEGDQVSFEVKRGRDGSYRIMEICDVDENGTDCLAD